MAANGPWFNRGWMANAGKLAAIIGYPKVSRVSSKSRMPRLMGLVKAKSSTSLTAAPQRPAACSSIFFNRWARNGIARQLRGIAARELEPAPTTEQPLLPHLTMPAHHDVRPTDVFERRLRGNLAAAADCGPRDFPELLIVHFDLHVVEIEDLSVRSQCVFRLHVVLPSVRPSFMGAQTG